MIHTLPKVLELLQQIVSAQSQDTPKTLKPSRTSSPPPLGANAFIPGPQVFGCDGFGFAPNLGNRVMTRCPLDKTVQTAETGAGQNVTGPIGVTSGGRGGTTGSFRLVNKQRGGGFIAELYQRKKTTQNSVSGIKISKFCSGNDSSPPTAAFSTCLLFPSAKSQPKSQTDGQTDRRNKTQLGSLEIVDPLK